MLLLYIVQLNLRIQNHSNKFDFLIYIDILEIQLLKKQFENFLNTDLQAGTWFGIVVVVPPSAPCIFHYVKLHICRLCIPNVVFDFSAMPQIMFMNMWVSISGFNDEHHFRFRVIPAVVVKGKSCMCCDNQGKSSLFICLPFLG